MMVGQSYFPVFVLLLSTAGALTPTLAPSPCATATTATPASPCTTVSPTTTKPPVVCKSFTCDTATDWLCSHAARDNVPCKDGKCTDEQCCVQKCKSVTCGKDFLSKDNNTVCVGKCDADQCCDKQPTCKTYSCDDPCAVTGVASLLGTWMLKPKPANITCKALVCKKDECCEPPVKCSSFKCDAGGSDWVTDNADHNCKNQSCTIEQCCVQKCESVTCATDFKRKDNNTVCTGNCSTPVNGSDQCCDKLPTCKSLNCTVLPGDFTPLTKPEVHTCQDLTCTRDECCLPPVVCEKYTCVGAGWLPNKANGQHICKDRTCTDKQCCIQKCKSVTCGKDMFNKGNDTVCVGKCDTDQCCSDNPTCGGFKCADSPCATNEAVVPGDWMLRSKPEDIICTGKMCTKKQCCEPPVKCSSFACNATQDWLPDTAKNDSICTNRTCTDKQCCIQKCSSVTCGDSSLAKNASTVCVGKCDTDQCCDKLPTCKAFHCPDDPCAVVGGTGHVPGDWTLKPKSENITCDALKCKKDECCEPPVKCSSFTCNATQDWLPDTAKNDSICTDRTCTDAQCCIKKCKSHTCSKDTHSKDAQWFTNTAKAKLVCSNQSCTDDQCCSEKCYVFLCGAGFKSNADTTLCAGKCTSNECCVQDKTCANSNVTCAGPCATVGDNSLMKENASTIMCPAKGCTKDTCCDKPAVTTTGNPDPCAPTAARLFSDKAEVAAQTKEKEVGQALGMMPVLGMFAMCALVAGVGASLYKRRVRGTRQLTLLSQGDDLEDSDLSDSLALE